MFCEAPVTTARASGLGAGTGMPTIVDRRSIGSATMASRAARARVGPVGLRVDGFERDRRHVRVLGLPHQDRRRRPAGRDHAGELARPCPHGRRRHGRVVRTGHRGVGGCSTAATTHAGRAHRDVGAADLGDEPDPRRPALPGGRPGVARFHGGVQRPGQCSVQRDAAPVGDTRDVRPSVRIRLGCRLYRQRGAAARGVRGVHLRRRADTRAAAHPGRRRAERARGDADDRGVDGGVRAAGADRPAAAGRHRPAR